MDYFVYCFKHYFDCKGRARRKEFWFFFLFYMLFSLVWGIFAALIFMAIWGEQAAIDKPLAVALTAVLPPLVMLPPYVAVIIRRLHDIGKDWYWIFLFFVPSLLCTIGDKLSDGVPRNTMVALAVIINILCIVLMLINSQEGENVWGPNPKQQEEEEEAADSTATPHFDSIVETVEEGEDSQPFVEETDKD